MKLYKLTNEHGNTKNNMHWEIGTVHEVSGAPKLCSSTVIHAYTSPLLAVFMNSAYGAFSNPLAFEAEGEVLVSDGTKVGVQKLTITGVYKLPKVSLTQRVAFGILCALEVCSSPSFFVSWANKWLSGVDRSKTAADATDAAAYAAANAAAAAANAAAAAAAYAATAAAYAAEAAAAAAAAAADAAYADAADACSADAAACSADAACSAKDSLDFQRLAEKALTYE